MTAAPPPRDSVLDALGYAVRVLGKPGFLWAPAVLYVILLLPLLATPAILESPPRLATQADLEAYFRAFVPLIVGSMVTGIVIGPLLSAVMYRLATQYVDGEPPEPFGPGIVGLAWRFFLQTLVFVLLAIAGTLAVILLALFVQAIFGVGLAIFLATIAGIVGYLLVVFRVVLAPVLLLEGAGPLESIGRSWQLTRGHLSRIFRWVIVGGLVVGLGAAAISGVIAAMFAAVGQPAVGQFLGTLAASPLALIGPIVVVLLARLLSGPVAAPPQPVLPAWMNANPSAPEPPTAPPGSAG